MPGCADAAEQRAGRDPAGGQPSVQGSDGAGQGIPAEGYAQFDAGAFLVCFRAPDGHHQAIRGEGHVRQV